MEETSLQVEYLQGIHVVDTILWLDAPRRADLCYLSSARLSRPVPHGKVLVSEPTARLAARFLSDGQTLICPFGQRFSLGGLDLTPFPSGHLLGAGQLLVRRGQSSLAYTGRFDLRQGRAREAGRVLACDVLIAHAELDLDLPGQAEEEARLAAWLAEALSSRAQPILFCDPLGMAQELIQLCGQLQLRCRVHRSIYSFCKKYKELGFDLGAARLFSSGPSPGEVCIMPAHLADSQTLRRLERPRPALVDSRPATAKLAGLERFALSCDADRRGLQQYAEESGAGRIYLVGPAASRAAEALRRQGHRAWALLPPQQIDLPLLAS
ncbi:MAG: hypothetical protein JXR96_14710 [Deltaproteobacteria bacterium]|nr:hypothetical protein [Deltaproteobacteria bacterium]